jgi:hypothetical protein
VSAQSPGGSASPGGASSSASSGAGSGQTLTPDSFPLPFVPAVQAPQGVFAPYLFHLDGMPVRAAFCDGRLFRPASVRGGPGAPISTRLDHRLWLLPGVYVLLWPWATGTLDYYVGSSGNVMERPSQHLAHAHGQKNWLAAILLTGHGLSRGGALQLESALARVLVNAVPGSQPRHRRSPTAWGADMPWYLLEPIVVLLNRILDLLPVNVLLDPSDARL